MTVYVLTTGFYSDYTIRGVFSTRELAQVAAEMWKKIGNYGEEIAAYTVDESADPVIKDSWCITLRMKDGKVEQNYPGGKVVVARAARGTCSNPPIGGRVQACSYVSAKHAMKLAVECRQRILRQATERDD